MGEESTRGKIQSLKMISIKKVDPVHVEKSKDFFNLKFIPIKKDEETQYLKEAYKSGFVFIEGCSKASSST